MKPCKTCKHLEFSFLLSLTGNSHLLKCKRTCDKIDPVTGETDYQFASRERSYGFSGRCGPEGKFHSDNEENK